MAIIRPQTDPGDERVTVRNLEVLESDPARGLLIIAGAVPGPRSALLAIRYSKHTLADARTRKPVSRAEREAQEKTPADDVDEPKAAVAEAGDEPEAAEQPETPAHEPAEAAADADGGAEA